MDPSITISCSIERCKRLVEEMLPAWYDPPGNESAVVGTSPTIVLANGDNTVGLWGRSLAPCTLMVNMSLPGIRRTLKELAESGAPWTDFQAVRYQFIVIEPPETPAANPITIDNSNVLDWMDVASYMEM
ncbi:hypothetical protein FDECE_3174 [Fusarium decemcellulare]|nr:hypothetical protein FDECE_3174 [Fusarium decemcellulare]